ncbi:M28 family peptidase [Cytobacillus purgationiresistens]|uniref:Aminopeptidase YwaD n=1 Tax=Cytobacillus purgationiresistens TaxID=863449 RepID=A0ABU0AR79_9BACI|nr:M28 family peptidase [Cytobacillus purgationiresistens]MDQ0273793.1 aminopeptidase YwaD [Cytobacillus purgationiresistens]
MKIRRLSILLSAILIMSFLTGFSPQSTYVSNSFDSSLVVQEDRDASIANLYALIEKFEKDGEFASTAASRILKTHIAAVEHYEKNKSFKKAIKHMEGFQILLTSQEEGGLISENAAGALREYTDSLISNWEVIFDSERVMDHIRQLSVAIGPRVAGSSEEKQAAQYLKNEFESYGYDTSLQEFPINNRVERKLQIITDKNNKLPLGAASGSIETGEHGVTGNLFDAGLGLPNQFTDSARGKIALIQRGENSYWEKVQNATEAGAIGVVIYDNIDSLTPLRPALNNSSRIPVVGTSKKDGETLRTQLSKEEVKANLLVQTQRNQNSQNVIAVKKPANVINPEIVYITSHYDSIAFSPGANDDASGTSTIVEMARIMKDMPTDKEIRFVAFGAEEIGLVGSNEYVRQLPQADIDRSGVNFQLEMLGAKYEPASYLAVNTVDGQPNRIWDFTNAAFDKLGKDKEKLILFRRGSSDHVPFHNLGITAACFNMGTVSGGLEPEYHTPHDTIENISPERLQFAGDIISTAIFEYLAQTALGEPILEEAS